MRYGLKERLVGALALIAVAVILLPFVLQEKREIAQAIDPVLMPAIPDSVVTEKVDLLPPVLTPLASAVTGTEAAADTGLELDSATGGTQAWTIQLASFIEEGNARQLLQRLQAENQRAYLRLNGALYVVLVGPYLNRQQALDDQQQLSLAYDLQGLVLRYVPEHEAQRLGQLPPRDE